MEKLLKINLGWKSREVHGSRWFKAEVDNQDLSLNINLVIRQYLSLKDLFEIKKKKKRY